MSNSKTIPKIPFLSSSLVNIGTTRVKLTRTFIFILLTTIGYGCIGCTCWFFTHITAPIRPRSDRFVRVPILFYVDTCQICTFLLAMVLKMIHHYYSLLCRRRCTQNKSLEYKASPHKFFNTNAYAPSSIAFTMNLVLLTTLAFAVAVEGRIAAPHSLLGADQLAFLELGTPCADRGCAAEYCYPINGFAANYDCYK